MLTASHSSFTRPAGLVTPPLDSFSQLCEVCHIAGVTSELSQTRYQAVCLVCPFVTVVSSAMAVAFLHAEAPKYVRRIKDHLHRSLCIGSGTTSQRDF